MANRNQWQFQAIIGEPTSACTRTGNTAPLRSAVSPAVNAQALGHKDLIYR